MIEPCCSGDKHVFYPRAGGIGGVSGGGVAGRQGL